MRILSGIQPSGNLHIGNYFGMMKPVIDLQDENETFLFIANYHAMTTVHDSFILKNMTMSTALDFLACGLNPEKTAFYRQSDIPEVNELAWFLSILTPMGLLERCHSFKDKTAKGIMASHGLFSYPLLMAADILSVNANIIPVGRDQKQHVEVTRDLASKFNNIFKEVFIIPEPKIQEEVAVIPGTDGQKMSKSYNNTIEINDAGKSLKKTVMKIVTDSKGLEDVKNAEKCNIFALYKLFSSDEEQNEMVLCYKRGGMGYGHAKTELLKKIELYFAPIRDKRKDLEKDLDYVQDVLKEGAKKASSIATDVLSRAREAVGL